MKLDKLPTLLCELKYMRFIDSVKALLGRESCAKDGIIEFIRHYASNLVTPAQPARFLGGITFWIARAPENECCH